MMKRMLATTALASVLAMGAYAQTTTDPAIEDPAATEQAPAEVMPEATDPAEAPATAQEVEPMEDPALAEPAEPADPLAPEDPAVAEPAEPVDPLAPEDPAVATGEGVTEEVWTQVDDAAVSADTLIGADIQTMEEEQIATVNDVLLTPDGGIENIVAEFGGFLGFGAKTVLLTMDDVDVYQNESGTFVLRSSLTPEMLESMPDYEG